MDQKGPINTLRDPLAGLPNEGSDTKVGDVDKLADRMVRAWFGFSMGLGRDSGPPPTHLYKWPEDSYRRVEAVLLQIRKDPGPFFALLAEAGAKQDAVTRLAERYDLAPDEAASLLDQPIRSIWKS